MSGLARIRLEWSELEAMRLCDVEGCDQQAAGERMGVSRGTVQRLLKVGRAKVVRALAHDILVMRRGRVIEQGPAEDVIGDPKDPYTKALMAAAFELKADESGVVSV